jgi:hypothetical protein
MSIQDLDEYFNNTNLKGLTTTIVPTFINNEDVLKENSH